MPTWFAFAALHAGGGNLAAWPSVPRAGRRMVGRAGTAQDRSRKGGCRSRPGQAMTV